MLKRIADGVLMHQSKFCQSNTIVVQGSSGVLVVDPGILDSEIMQLADDLHVLGQPVVAGFSTHPHWDHLLWHAKLGSVPRYGMAANAAATRAFLADPHWKARITPLIPPDIVEQVPLDLLGLITALPKGATYIPWDGPKIRIIEHRAHASGHAALLIEERRVLVAGDMLSDVLIPLLDLNAVDPIQDYLAALRLLDKAADKVGIFIPGHGSIGETDQMRTRIEQDQAYVQALHDGRLTDDPRVGPSATYDWVASVHERQLQQLNKVKKHDEPLG